MLKVEGEENKVIYSGKQNDVVYLGEGSAIQEIPGQKAPALKPAQTMEERMAAGQVLYKRNCAACHQAEGAGIAGVFPPLAASDFITSPEVVSSAVANGLSGEIKVNGTTYNGVMPKLGLSDEEIANVSTYVLNSWKNKGGEVTPAAVAKIRTEGDGPGGH